MRYVSLSKGAVTPIHTHTQTCRDVCYLCDFVVTYYFVMCFILCWKCLSYSKMNLVIMMDVINKWVETQLKNFIVSPMTLLCSEKFYIIVVIKYFVK